MSGVKIYDGEKFVNFNISNGIELHELIDHYLIWTNCNL